MVRVPLLQGARSSRDALWAARDVSAWGSGAVPCRSPAHLASEGLGKAGAVVFRRFASLENK